MSEFGFTAKQAKTLGELLGPIALELAALRSLLLAKGLVTPDEIAREKDRLDKAAIIKRLERDLGGG